MTCMETRSSRHTDYSDSPYKHTLLRDGEGPVLIRTAPAFKCRSPRRRTSLDFRVCDNLTTTSVVKGTPVYVQIRPVGFNNITYDRWRDQNTPPPPPVTTIRWRKPFREPSVTP